MYINTETSEYPVSLRDIKRAHPNVSFPKTPDDATLNALGYAVVQSVPRPDGDVVTEGEPELVGGTWQQTWNVREHTAEELEQQRQASVPRSVTPRQARLALLQAGLLSQVGPALDALESPDKEAAKIEWEYATTVERDSGWVNTLGQALGLSEADKDNLFITADTL